MKHLSEKAKKSKPAAMGKEIEKLVSVTDYNIKP
jgi:hypothetical protein